METTPETCVLYSALQLCDKQVHGGLRASNKEETASSEYKNIFTILTSAIDEIVGGLEFDSSDFEKRHWRFEIATMLTTLAIREEYESEINQECDLFIFLRPFPSLNVKLLFDLIYACRLEVAFFRVLELFDIEMRLKLIGECLGHMTRAASLSDNGVEHVTALLNVHLQYVLLHESGVHVCAHEADDETVRHTALQIIENSAEFVEKFVLNATPESASNFGDILAVLFVGLLNFTKASLDKSVNTYDILSVDLTDTMRNLKPSGVSAPFDAAKDVGFTSRNGDAVCRITDTMQFQEFSQAYNLSPESYCDVMTVLFRTEAEKAVKAKRLSRVNVPDKFNSSILKTLIKTEKIQSLIISELNFSNKRDHVVYASTSRWQLSAVLGFFLQNLYSDLDNTLAIFERHPPTGAEQSVEILKGVQKELNTDIWAGNFTPVIVGEEVKFSKALLIIGEKLLNWKVDFNWLLVKCTMVNDPRYLLCLTDNRDTLASPDNTKLLWDRLVGLTAAKSSPEVGKTIASIRELFLSIFERHDIKLQNLLMMHVFSYNEKLTDLFDLDSTRVFARLTVLLNRLVEFEPGSDVVSQISTLALQCPKRVLSHLVKNAAQNQKQCDIIVSLLHRLRALAQFGMQHCEEEYIYECIRNVLKKSGDFSDKEQRDFIYFIMKGVSTPNENITVDPVKDVPSVAEGTKEMSDRTTPLLDFVYVWSRTLCPIMNEVHDSSDVTSMFYDEKYEFCLKVMAAVLRKNRFHVIDNAKGHDAVLVALLMNVCRLLVGWESIVSPENVCLLDECKMHLLDMHSNLCQILEWNFTNISGNFHCFQFHWLLMHSEEFPWHMKAYLFPLVNKFFTSSVEAEGYKKEHKLQLELFLPHKLSHLLDIYDNPAIGFNQQKYGDKNQWISSLKLVVISDVMCDFVCRCLRPRLIKSDRDYEHFMGAMLEFLPKCIDVEWVRVATFLKALFHNSLSKDKSERLCLQRNTCKANDTEPFEPNCELDLAQSDPMLVLFDVVIMLLASDDVDPGTESHILKCFLRAVYTCLDYNSPNTAAAKDESSATKRWAVDAGTSFGYFLQMCRLIGRVSGEAGEHLVGVLLELLDMSVNRTDWTFGRGGVTGDVILPTVQKVVPEAVGNVIFKKIEELKAQV